MPKKNKIKIKTNGKYMTIKNDFTVKNLLNKLNLSPNMVAIELNKKILKKNKISKQILKDKDNIEIVHFIGGG
tara:strand:- start:319 stop:537 length:219 start_codon:yes stop_codon:yes gene_type:complete